MITALIFILCGCHTNDNTYNFDNGKDVSKKQEITVVSAGTSENIKNITSKEDIENFVAALNLDEWQLKTLPSGATEIGHFEFQQEETIKLGQADTDGTLHDVAAITLYDDAYISLETGTSVMTFKIGKDTADYLKGYFEQGK